MSCITIPLVPDVRLVGDPIDVVTGASYDITTDVIQQAPIPFRWVRHYSSVRSYVSGPLGWAHAHEFERYLRRDLDGLRLEMPLGVAVPFTDLDIGATEAVGGLRLTRRSEREYTVDQAGQPQQHFRFASGDNTGRLIALEQAGLTMQFRYDGRGRLAEILDARERPIELAYDERGHLVSLRRVAPPGPLAGRLLLAYEYNEAGCLIRVTDLYHTTQTFEWDAARRVTRRADRRGYAFHFRHDAEGRCIHSRGDDGMFEVFLDYNPAAKTSFVRRADGGQWIYRYNDQQVITEIIDPLGNSTSFVLDDRGRPVQEIDPNGQVTELHYGAWGQHDFRSDPLGYRQSPSRPQSHDPLSYELPEAPLEWEFGQLLDAQSIRRPEYIEALLEPFPAPVINSVLGRTTSYDGSGASSPSEPDDGDEEADEELGEWNENAEFGQAPEWRSRAYGERWKFDPNGNEIEHRDRDGAVYRAVYDSWNSRRQQIDPLGGTITFQHNAQGLVTQVRDAGGTVTDYGYDLCDRLVEVRRQGRLRERYLRDGVGNLIRKEDAQGRVLITWDIGAGNQFRARHLASGETHTFERDDRGRVVSMATPAGAVTFTYDVQGRRLSDQRDEVGITHRFDRDGIASSVYLKQFEVQYRRTDEGDWIVIDPVGGRHRFQVSTTGLICKTLARGDRELVQYNQAGQCRRKVVWRPSPPEDLWMRHFRYSPAGDLLAVADNRAGETRYVYDAAHRLQEERLPDGTARRFDYDPAGNLLAQPGLSDVTIEAANRMASARGERIAYNARDHLGSRTGPQGVTRYEYNELDLLVRCELNGESWTAQYDGFCRRVAKTWRGATTTYYWDDFRLAAERFPDGSLRIYVYADDAALVPFLFVDYASDKADPTSGRSYYLFTNPIGVPVRVEDAEGRCCWSATIDPYGHARVDPASTLNLSLRFPGHWYDDETRLHFNRFRYYSPDLGRYLQSDPLGIPGGGNLYAYPANPLTAVDLDGLAKRGGTRTPKPRTPKPKKSQANNASEGTPDKSDCPFAAQGGGPKPPEPGWELNEQNVRQRMQQLGVPPDKHGYTGRDGTKQPALVNEGHGIAGHNNAGGISVDGKDIKNDNLFSGSPYPKTDEAWKKATPQERCDAVIIHENTERLNGTNHEAAIRKSPAEGKKQGVSENTQGILDAMNDESVGV